MTEWAQEVLIAHGVGMLVLLILLENVFPPIPSEVILPLAGFLVFEGQMSFAEALVAATVGSVSGAVILYALGRHGGRPLLLRYGRVLRLDERRLDRADEWFDRHGPKIVLFGRMLPGVRSVVSVPAGLSEMRVPVFLALTALGSASWNAALIGAGWALGGSWHEVGEFIGPLTMPVLVTVTVLGVGYVVFRMRRARHRGVVSEERFLDALRVEMLRHADLRPERRDHLLFQTSTIDALLAGHFDGDVTIAELAARGDLGLGTLNGIDGELVVVDGRAWQARLDGSLHAVPGEALTPYAVVTRFDPDRRVELQGPLDFDAMTARLDADGRPGAEGAAVRVDGRFAVMRVRSVPRQEPPYPPLADVVAQQQVTELHDVEGTVVGFRFPGPLDGVEIAGWHLHFVDTERARGGHVLGCVLDHGTAALDHEADLHVELPPGVDAPHQGAGDAGLMDRLERD